VESSFTSEFGAAESEITLGLLTAVDRNHLVTQRSLARELGIALGLANGYLKRCAKKGLIKVTSIPANRYAYYLTPQGFAEKSRLTAEFLTQSFRLFRIARAAYGQMLADCDARGLSRVIVVGGSDLAEIIQLCVRESGCRIVQVWPSVPAEDNSDYDVILLADLKDPQGTYDTLVARFGLEKIMVPDFLNISKRSRSSADRAEP
jgi:DNA-binding MarR family transcriptional regulator